ncbi:hypothetical protein MIB92_14685 [Aestuariirhabdus sp. Z084]|uniref:hypothetical protein n=1 Tax=Aestuariirhabdus haliotis TaxID=2918751 RepID=UPI00201B460A|nr:hypothetical protein [Aestuariirhabdus haliotis]MCL6416905.1 hypothetical protein [Aestuariirhabdus haliotis]MCL6420933.1 hypothetical protein [Aestuariirhabdus haliotis]
MRKCFLLLALFFPSVCYANGGLPIIWMLNTYAFFIGIIFVFFIEKAYLKRFVNREHYPALNSSIIKFNIYSTLFGVVALPIFMMIVQLEPIFYLVSETAKETMNLIWWLSLSVDLVLAYVGTVFIEYYFLKKFKFWSIEVSAKDLLKHSFMFNLFSYSFLCILVFITYLYFKIT